MKRFVVIGLGRFGGAVATHLYKQGHEVLAIDKDEELVETLADSVTQAVAIDILDEKALYRLGVSNFDAALVTIGTNIQASILTTVILKDLGVKYIIAKAQSDLHAKVLEKVGADKVVFPERDMGIRVANNLTESNVLEYITLSPKYSVLEINTPAVWIGKSISSINIHSKHGVIVMAIKRGDKDDFDILPPADYVIRRDDTLVLIGDNVHLKEIKKV